MEFDAQKKPSISTIKPEVTEELRADNRKRRLSAKTRKIRTNKSSRKLGLITNTKPPIHKRESNPPLDQIQGQIIWLSIHLLKHKKLFITDHQWRAFSLMSRAKRLGVHF